jgi:hypothetical protein
MLPRTLLELMKNPDNDILGLDMHEQWYERPGPRQLQKHEHRAMRWRYKSLAAWKMGDKIPFLMIHMLDP